MSNERASSIYPGATTASEFHHGVIGMKKRARIVTISFVGLVAVISAAIAFPQVRWAPYLFLAYVSYTGNCGPGVRLDVVILRAEYDELRGTLTRFATAEGYPPDISSAKPPPWERKSLFSFLEKRAPGDPYFGKAEAERNFMRDGKVFAEIYAEVSGFESRAGRDKMFERFKRLETLLHERWPSVTVSRTCRWGSWGRY